MHRHAARLSDRLQTPAERQLPLIERMAGFMDDPHQRIDELVLVIAGGDADVVRRAAAERMQAGIEPAMIEVEAEGRHDALPQRFLLLDRERTARLDRRLFPGLALQ